MLVFRPGAMQILATAAGTTGHVLRAASSTGLRVWVLGASLASVTAQIMLTFILLVLLVFVLGFVADPIIRLYVDPWSYLPGYRIPQYFRYEDEEPFSWTEHFTKGIASMGVLGFLKVLIASPFSYFRFGGSGNRGRTGRDRMEQVSWVVILIGIFTFLVAVYRFVRAWSNKALQTAGERVMDVQGDDEDEQ